MSSERFEEASIEELGGIEISSLQISEPSRKAFIYGRRYRLGKDPQWRILFLHDIGEHSNRYHNAFLGLLKFFKKKKISTCEIVTFDYKGHGKSSGTRGHLDSVDDLCLDSLYFLNEEDTCQLPTIVMGVGLGSIVALKTYHHFFSKLKTKINGMILINPALKLNWNIPSALEGIARGGSLLVSKLRLPFHLEGRLFAGDSLVAEDFDSDPLVNHSITLGSLFELQHNASMMRTSAYYLDIPVMMAISGKEKLYSNKITELFSKGIKDCRVEHFPHADHDLFHHFDHEKLQKSIYNWMKDHSFFLKD